MKKITTLKTGMALLFMFISMLFICCNNNDDDDQAPNNNNTTPTTTYYIKAKINGTMVDAEYCTPNSDVVSNSYILDDKRFQIERYIASGTSQGYNIIVDGLDLDQTSYPKTLTYANYTGQPVLDVCYNNGTEGATGNFVINNLDSTLFSLTLSSFTNDILSGMFSGKLRWGSSYDSTLTFTDGEFKAKLIRY